MHIRRPIHTDPQDVSLMQRKEFHFGLNRNADKF